MQFVFSSLHFRSVNNRYKQAEEQKGKDETERLRVYERPSDN